MSLVTDIPPGHVAITVSCNVCGGPIHMHHDWTPEMLADLKNAAQFASLTRSVACVNCIDRADARMRNQRSAERLEVRSLTWATLCPHEFLKSLDWTQCRREPHDRIMAWTYGERGLYVSGKTGACKTRFACAVMHREHLAGRTCAFVAHVDFRREVTFLAQTDAAAMRRYLSVLTRADVVLFDDLGNGIVTPAGEEAFEMVVGSRTRNGKPLLITSNTNRAALTPLFSAERAAPIVRRLCEFTDEVLL